MAGEWNSSTLYSYGSLASVGSVIYCSLQVANRGYYPPSSPLWWTYGTSPIVAEVQSLNGLQGVMTIRGAGTLAVTEPTGSELLVTGANTGVNQITTVGQPGVGTDAIVFNAANAYTGITQTSLAPSEITFSNLGVTQVFDNASTASIGKIQFPSSAGISTAITGGPTNGQLTVYNEGLLGITAGSGISSSVTGGVATLANTGILAITPSTGISSSTTAGTATLTNTGATSAIPTYGTVVPLTGDVTMSGYGVTITKSLSGNGLTVTAVPGAGAVTEILDHAGVGSTGNVAFGNSSGITTTMTGGPTDGTLTVHNLGVLSVATAGALSTSAATGAITITNTMAGMTNMYWAGPAGGIQVLSNELVGQWCYITNASGFQCPFTTALIEYQLVGGGGGGGAAGLSFPRGGGGGGSGAFVSGSFFVGPTSLITVSIGQGGTAGVGSDGGDGSYTSLILSASGYQTTMNTVIGGKGGSMPPGSLGTGGGGGDGYYGGGGGSGTSSGGSAGTSTNSFPSVPSSGGYDGTLFAYGGNGGGNFPVRNYSPYTASTPSNTAVGGRGGGTYGGLGGAQQALDTSLWGQNGLKGGGGGGGGTYQLAGSATLSPAGVGGNGYCALRFTIIAP